MKFLGRIIFSVFSNSLAILGASYFIKDFLFSGSFVDLLMAAGIFTIINIFVRPIMKLLMGPLIILTLGLFIFVINALTVVLLDFFSASITINGLVPLLLTTLVFGITNILVNFSAKALFRKE